MSGSADKPRTRRSARLVRSPAASARGAVRLAEPAPSASRRSRGIGSYSESVGMAQTCVFPDAHPTIGPCRSVCAPQRSIGSFGTCGFLRASNLTFLDDQWYESCNASKPPRAVTRSKPRELV